VRPSKVGTGENRREFLAAELGGTFTVLLTLVEAFEEEQERKLLDGIERIGESAGPEFVPESLDGGSER
jgi:hypothetical protein